MSLIALSMAATTVHLWNVPFTFFFFFVGCAGWIADPVKVRAKVQAKKPAAPHPQPVPQYWPAASQPHYPGGGYPAPQPAYGY